MSISDEPRLFSPLIQEATQDLGKYLEEFAKLAENSDECSHLRERFKANIHHFTGGNEFEFHAVDGAHVRIPHESATTIIAGAIEFPTRRQSYERYFFQDTSPESSQIARSLSLVSELRLLSTAETSTILDNSFWSLLMECNQIVQQREHATGDVRDVLDKLIEEVGGANGLLFRVLENRNVVAISKRATSQYFARRIIPPLTVPDRLLFGRILCVDEWFGPRSLKDSTEGKTGVETNIEANGKIKRHYDEGFIQVIFFRPWIWTSLAYRLEFHKDRLASLASINDLLASVKSATRFRFYREPYQQFMADQLAKSINATKLIYEVPAMQRFPELARPYRTS